MLLVQHILACLAGLSASAATRAVLTFATLAAQIPWSASSTATRCAEPAVAVHQGATNPRPPTGPRSHIQARRQGGAALEHAADTTAAPPPPPVPRGQPAPAVVQAQAHAVACGISGGGLNFQSSDPPTQAPPLRLHRQRQRNSLEVTYHQNKLLTIEVATALLGATPQLNMP